MAEEHKNRYAHQRSSARASNRQRLKIVLALTIVYMLAEAIGGFLTNSLALLSDAGHMLTDVAALVLALLALWFAGRPVTPQKTYGYYRTEILAALANGVALVVISLLIFYEAIHRISNPVRVRGFEMVLIASGGLVVNAISAWLLRSASETNLNMRGAFLHIIGDVLGSAGAVMAGLLIWQLGWVLADPIISIAMCLMIIYSSWQLIRESVNVLLEGTPSHINIRAVVEAMHEIEGVTNVHDLHVWTISSGLEALSAHVTVEPNVSHRRTLEALQERLRSKFNIGHVTIQLEPSEEMGEESLKLYQIVRKSGADATDSGQGREHLSSQE
jgi:cobalt-zinc-cadmium efflux system protein